MTKEEHRKRHVQLHEALDELIGDWLRYDGLPSGRLLSDASIMDLVEWSYQQTLDPTEGEPGPAPGHGPA